MAADRDAKADRTIRLVDVARTAGVSQGTASNVFNRPDVVRPEVREKVEAAAKALGYKGPDPKGRLLRAGKVNAIGVATVEPIAYFFEDPFARTLMSGIAEACDRQGAGISLVTAANEEALAWNISTALVDGFILFCLQGGPRLVEMTRDRDLPFVALDLGGRDETVSAVGVDNVQGAGLAATHLADLGHTRFAILALPFVDGRRGPVTRAEAAAGAYASSRDRTEGYLSALAARGIDPETVPIFETENDGPTVDAAMEALFAAKAPPTALLAMSDRIAIAALDWLRARGRRVPADVSVVGFDGIPEGALSDPPLTTVSQPIAALGRMAVEMILDPRGAVRRETMPTTLVLRGSTAPAPASSG